MDDAANIDVQQVAADAAAQALAGVEPRATEDLRWIAEQSAASAAGAVADQVAATTDEDLQAVADSAAASTFELVKVQLQSEAEGDAATIYTVQLDATQYDALMLAGRQQLGASFLCMCMTAIVAGICLWSCVAREFTY